MKWMIFVLLLAGCSPASNKIPNPITGIPQINHLGTISLATGTYAETTPITFNNQVIDLAYNHTPVEIDMLNLTGNIQYPSVNTNGYALGSAMVYNNVVYSMQTYYPVLVGYTAYGNSVNLMSSSDLINWSPPQTVLQADSTFTFGNTSLTYGNGQFVVAYDTRQTYNPNWGIKVMTSPDMINWTSVGTEFQDNGYASTPAIRYINGYYYMFYTAPILGIPNMMCDVKVVRTQDFTNWEMQHISQVLLYPQDNEGYCDSDMDLTEFNGTTYLVYAFGDQGTGPNQGGIAEATYNGTIEQLLSLFFQ